MYFSKQVSTVQLDHVSLDSVLIKKISGLQFVKGVVPPSCATHTEINGTETCGLAMTQGFHNVHT